MYLDGKDSKDLDNQCINNGDLVDEDTPKGGTKFETVIYKDVLNGANSQYCTFGYGNNNAAEWAPPSYNPGSLMPLEDIDQAYDRNSLAASYYEIQQQLTSFPWQNPIALNQSTTTSTALESNCITTSQDSNATVYTQYTNSNNCNDIGNVYVPGNSRLDRSITVSDLVKLTEAINELTRRMPLPPTQELLKAIEPNLAMTLQLTYLHAYIQNQQLLMDIKNRIFGGVINGCDIKGGLKPAVPTLAAPPTADSESLVSETFEVPNIPGAPFENMSDISWNNNNQMKLGTQPLYPQTQPFAIGPSISDSNTLGNSLDSSDSQSLAYGDGNLMPYPTYVQAIDALNQEKKSPPLQIQRVTPALAYDSDMSVDVVHSGSEHSEPPANPTTTIPPTKEIMNAIPPEIRNMVKYDGQKHSFVSVYLGPLGARRRRLFSIRKFGIDEALKLATDFAVGSTSAAVATKERRLLEEVCEVALKSNPRSGEKLLHIDAATALPETRGLVFSCGAQLWMIIVYNASTGDRSIETFSVETLGFEGAYNAAVSALDEKLRNNEILTSKLSGPLFFWLESHQDDVDLCLMVTPRDLLRQGSSDQELYIGRFNILKSGGFNSARKLAQKWRSDLRSQLIY